MEPVTELRRRLKTRTQAALASELGISVQYLCDILADRRKPGPLVLDALGVEKVVTYRRKKSAHNGSRKASRHA